ncbi:MAG: tetratricopeptide repeat-containing sensor histidine kinase [Flavobacterium sp.]|jgi:signal transduction histidine kinase|uniref:tetratricopeptide repeat-containing sensor histidine kinase n=1 Tax=Flavobacterium sp. TaxID=239 RepID=UPI003BA49055
MIRKITIVFLFVIACQKKEKNSDFFMVNNLDQLIDSCQNTQISANEKLIVLKKASEMCLELPNDTLKTRNLRRISCEFYNIGFLNDYFKLTKDNIEFSKKINDSINLGKLYYDLGDYYYEKSINDSSFYYYNLSLKTLPNTVIEKQRSYFNLAKLYKNENQLIESEVQVIKTIKLIENDDDNRLMYECYNLLGVIQRGLKNYSEALKSFQNAKNYLVKIKDDEQYVILICENYNNTGNVFLEMNDFKNAEKYFKEAIQIIKKTNDYPLLSAILLDNLAYTKFKNNTLTNPKDYLKALKIRDSLNNKLGIIISKTRLGEFYLKQNDSLLANQYFSNAFSIAKDTRSYKDQLNLLMLKKKADPKNAYEYQNTYIKLSDSLLLQERNTRNKFAKIIFETEQIEEEKILLTKKINYILVISFFSFLLLVTLYILYRQKVKNKVLMLEKEQQVSNEEVYNLLLNQQQQLEQVKAFEKKRIATELHDGVVSDLFGIRLHLERLIFLEKELDVKSLENYLQKLNDLENEIRLISHKLHDDVNMQNEGFNLLLENYLTDFEQDFSIKINLQKVSDINWEMVNNDKKINIYRIIQEALSNCRKYSKASQINISFKKDDENIFFSIADNGIGFNTEAKKNGIGLKNMKFRIENSGGKFKLNSSNKGTIINCSLPLKTVQL